MLVDSHCHLDFPDFEPERDAVLARARAAGVGYFLTIGTRLSQFSSVRQIAEANADVSCTVGVHPHSVKDEQLDGPDVLRQASAHPKVVGFGETGLDFYYDNSPREAQIAYFRLHIAAARTAGLPLVVHTRDAEDDTIEILSDEMGKGAFPGLLHCFTGTAELAKAALDLSRESKATQTLYGMDDPLTREYGSRCLIARRLIERGVRFVQVFTQNQFWDHHGRIFTSLPAACQKVDKPAAALIKDLKSRGLLDSTVVHWGGEMGRLPVIQNDTGRKNVGRDHNTHGFSMWLAGGGFKQGCVYGATDDFGHHAVEDVVNHYDYHATLLHLFGLDHAQLIYKRNGREQTLTDGQPSRIVSEILEHA